MKVNNLILAEIDTYWLVKASIFITTFLPKNSAIKNNVAKN